MTQPPAGDRRRARRILLWLLCLSTAPIIVSTVIYYATPPRGGASYGELIARPLPVTVAPGQWALAVWSPAPCDAGCNRRLGDARRLQIAQGEAASRLDVVWLHPPGRPARYGTVQAVVLPAEALAGLASGLRPQDDLYLIDPHGNLVLRYPAGFDPRRVMQEIGKVMKINRRMG